MHIRFSMEHDNQLTNSRLWTCHGRSFLSISFVFLTSIIVPIEPTKFAPAKQLLSSSSNIPPAFVPRKKKGQWLIKGTYLVVFGHGRVQWWTQEFAERTIANFARFKSFLPTTRTVISIPNMCWQRRRQNKRDGARCSRKDVCPAPKLPGAPNRSETAVYAYLFPLFFSIYCVPATMFRIWPPTSYLFPAIDIPFVGNDRDTYLYSHKLNFSQPCTPE